MLRRTGPCRIPVCVSEFLDAEGPGRLGPTFWRRGGEGDTGLKLKWVAGGRAGAGLLFSAHLHVLVGES